MTKSKQGWCFIGTGSIATDVIKDAPWLNIVSVVSGHYENAVRFAAQYGGVACETLDEALDIPGVTAVYIATAHSMHAEQSIRALSRKKAVLCEKPLCVNAGEAKKIIKAARDNSVFLSEAMWTRFNPVTKEVRKWLAEKRIGELRYITADFSAQVPTQDETSRFFAPELAAGSVLDMGVYPVSYCSMIMGEQPEEICTVPNLTKRGIDVRITSLLRYKNGVTASIHSGMDANTCQNAVICGSEGYIVVPKFLRARSASIFNADGKVLEFARTDTNSGLCFEFEAVEQYIADGLLEAPEIPHEETVAIMTTIDRIRNIAGIKYPFE